MTTADIYNWLFNNKPDGDNTQLKLVWTNMASYCYFINAMDFDRLYTDKLEKILKMSSDLGINIPDSNHKKVLDIGKQLQKTGTVSELREMLHEH